MLAQAGLTFTSQTARIDEAVVKAALLAEQPKPRDIADTLAEMKAQRISVKQPEALVIGSDQVLDLQGTLLSKPESVEEARVQLRQLRGQEHRLFSAAVIMKGGQPQWRHIGQVRLWMRDFSDSYLENYLDRMGEEVTQTVGGYKLEGEGIRLFSHIEGDYFNVLGLPLMELLTHLTRTGAIEG